MVTRCALLSLLLDVAHSHGSLVWPPPRQDGATTFAIAGDEKRGCFGRSCNYRTGNAQAKTSGQEGVDYTWIKDVDPKLAEAGGAATTPWRAPGTSNVMHPCGRYGGTARGKTTLDFPVRKMVKWQRGTTQQVAWTLFHNHEGGYAYRLLKVPEHNPKNVKEVDFQGNTLEFVGDTSTVHTTDGDEFEIPASRGFVTANKVRQQWTKNPIPQNTRNFKLPAGITSKNFYNTKRSDPYYNWKFSLIDDVKIPANLEPGHYYISWRWDGSTVFQNFCQCGDVEITADGPSTPLPFRGGAPADEDEGSSDTNSGSESGTRPGGSGKTKSGGDKTFGSESAASLRKRLKNVVDMADEEMLRKLDDYLREEAEPEPEPEAEPEPEDGSPTGDDEDEGISDTNSGSESGTRPGGSGKTKSGGDKTAGSKVGMKGGGSDTNSVSDRVAATVIARRAAAAARRAAAAARRASRMSILQMDEAGTASLRERPKNVVDMADDPQSSETMMLKGGSISAVMHGNGEVELSDFGAP